MHELMIFIAAIAFGALAWVMLVVSDWLLRDKKPTEARQRKTDSVRYRNEPVELAYHY